MIVVSVLPLIVDVAAPDDSGDDDKAYEANEDPENYHLVLYEIGFVLIAHCLTNAVPIGCEGVKATAIIKIP